jgi:hypothetical protein
MQEIPALIKITIRRFVGDEGGTWSITEDVERTLARTVFADGSGPITQDFLNRNRHEPHVRSDDTKLICDPEQLLKLWQAFGVLHNTIVESLETCESMPFRKMA